MYLRLYTITEICLNACYFKTKNLNTIKIDCDDIQGTNKNDSLNRKSELVVKKKIIDCSKCKNKKAVLNIMSSN